MTPEERALLRQDELEAKKWREESGSTYLVGSNQRTWHDSDVAAYVNYRLAAARAGERELLERCTSICNQQLEAARQSGMFAGPLELARNNLVKLMAELFPASESEKGTNQ